jgi:hypothetical protein
VQTRVKMAGSTLGARPIASQQASQASTDPPARITSRINKPSEAINETIPLVPESSAGNSSAPIAFYGEVVVTWESAQPVRLSRQLTSDAPLTPEFDNHYAVRITGLPAQTFMPETGRSPVIFRLLIGTTLEMNGRKREQSDYVLRMPQKNSILFAFPTHDFPLHPADRFVSFAMDLNQMMVRARFDLRLMNYGDAIAL